MTLFGIDVSHHQGRIDWDAIATAGLSFAIVRVSYGGLFDREGARNLSWAKRRVPVAGAYHFLYQHRVVAATTQADAFVAAVGDPTGLLICLDVERDGDSIPTMFEVDQFMRRLREHWPTHPVMLYAPSWYWTGYIGNPRAAHIGKLWHSRFLTVLTSGLTPQQLYPGVPASWWTVRHGGWTEPTILQFSSKAWVPGLEPGKRVDANAFRGTLGDLRGLTRPPGLPDTSTEGIVGLNVRLPDELGVGTIRIEAGATIIDVATAERTTLGSAVGPRRAYAANLGDPYSGPGYIFNAGDPPSETFVRAESCEFTPDEPDCSAVEARAAQLQTDLAAANLRADNLEADLAVAAAKIAAARAALS